MSDSSERVTTTYYFVGGQRIAMRQNGLTYLHGDHRQRRNRERALAASAQRYHPYGETRYGDAPTDRRYTGQRYDSALGLYDYQARYYAPGLGRFISADAIVPNPANPQSLNRYSYVLNNPLRYTDPSGHIEENEIDDANVILETLRLYGVRINIDWGRTLGISGDDTIWCSGLWKLHELDTILQVIIDFSKFSGFIEATREAIGGVIFQRTSDGPIGLWGDGRITLGDRTFNQSGLRKTMGPRIAIVHELAHYWDWKTATLWAKVFNQSGLIVQNFPKDVGPTAYGRINLDEAWAESVAGFVYPGYFAILRAEGSRIENYQQPLQYGPITVNFSLPGLTPKNRAYVERQFRALQRGK